MRPVITLTTDFGLSDPYVGVMKGVILGIAPDATLVDLCHDVRPQDIAGGALVLEAAAGYFPPRTIHLAVVDPGVGSAREAVAVETGRSFLVGPNNGLFIRFLAREPCWRAVRLTNPAYFRQPVSRTFHGRDIFAPVAAHLAAGVRLEDLGEPIEGLINLDLPEPVARGADLELHVLARDRFGNLVTDLTRDQFDQWTAGREEERIALRIGTTEIAGLSRTYTDVAPGHSVAYFGSGGRLEIGVRDGNAAEQLNVGPEAIVLLKRV